MKLILTTIILFFSCNLFSQCKVTTTDISKYIGTTLGKRTNSENTVNVYITSVLYTQNLEFALSVITQTVNEKYPYPFACRQLEIVFHDGSIINLKLDICNSLEDGNYMCNFIITEKQLDKLLVTNIKNFRIMDNTLLHEIITIYPTNFRILREQLNCLINSK